MDMKGILEIPGAPMVARAAGLKTEVPFPPERRMELVSKLRMDLRDRLPEFDNDKKNDLYIMRNTAPEVEDQCSLLTWPAAIQVLWSTGTDAAVVDVVMDAICSAADSIVPGFSGLLEHIDAQYYFSFETTENQYQLIRDAYFIPTTFGRLFTGGRLQLTNDFTTRILIDPGCVLVIRVEGEQKENDIRRGMLDKEQLKIQVSVGRNSGFGAGTLRELVRKHLASVDNLVISEIIPAIVQPLGEVVQGSALSRSEKNK